MKTSPSFLDSELKRALWGFRKEFAVCMLFTMLVNLLMLTPTLYMLQLFDRVMVSMNLLTLLMMTLVMLFFFMVTAFAEWSRSKVLVRLGVKLDQQLNSRVFAASFESSLRQTGQNPAQSLNDLTNVRQFLTGNGLFAFMDVPWTPLYIAVLFMMHPWLGLLSIVFSLILILLAWLSNKHTRGPVETALEAGGKLGSFVQSKLRNAEVIEAMGMLGDLRQRWLVRHRHYLGLNWRASDASARHQALTKFVRYTQQSLALGAGALLVIRGELSPGAMIASNILISRATQPLDAMVGTWKTFLGTRQAFRRLEALLARHPQREGVPLAAAPAGQLRLQNLVATVPARAEPVLKGLTVNFPAGEVIGIIGPSGSGKSTLARVLVGIWPWVEGEALLDGTPLQHWDRESLGPHLGYLPQDIELFEGSIAANIARFGPVDPDKVIRASQRAGVHEMILRFAKGYDTEIGEAGHLLSGGQRQRIALARAMYGEPRVLVLDEPNSNLDDIGEAALLKAVQDLRAQGSTVFVVSHRPNILSVTDCLLRLSDGQITHYGARKDVITALSSRPAALPSGPAMPSGVTLPA